MFQKMVKNLYKPNSARSVGSLPYYKVQLERTNVNGQVKGRFQAHEDFVHTVGTSLLLRLAMDKMAMKDLNDAPQVPGLPENISKLSIKNRKHIFHQMMLQIVEEIFSPFKKPERQTPINLHFHVPGEGRATVRITAEDIERLQEVEVTIPGMTDPVLIVHAYALQQDELKNYSTQLLQWYLQLADFQDAIKEGDPGRCLVGLKLMIPFFFGHSVRSKYFIECVDYVLKTQILLPPALSLR